MSSPSVEHFREWFKRFGNFAPTKTEDACFQAGVEWALSVTGQASRQGSDLRGRVIVLYRPLTDEEVQRELGPPHGLDRAQLDEEIAKATAAKEVAISAQDFESAAALRDRADKLKAVKHDLLDAEKLRGWACLELDDGTLIYGARPGTYVASPFVGFKPSAPEGQRKVGFGIQYADSFVQVAAGPEAT